LAVFEASTADEGGDGRRRQLQNVKGLGFEREAMIERVRLCEGVREREHNIKSYSKTIFKNSLSNIIFKDGFKEIIFEI